MKRKLAGVLICVLPLFGCNNDVEQPQPQRRASIDTPRGKVLVQDPIRNPGDRYLTASVTGDGIEATLHLEAIGDGSSMTGTLAELRGKSGELLYSLETIVSNVTGEVVYTQSTPEDYLAISISGDDERVYERYDANGDVASFEYPALPDDTQRRAANHYEHGMPGAHLPADVSEYVSQLGAFDEYYQRHANSTLHGNPAGELLMQILSNDDVGNLIVGDTPESERTRWFANTCAMARACVSLFCRINPSSLICGLCWSIAVVCSIMEMVAQWGY